MTDPINESNETKPALNVERDIAAVPQYRSHKTVRALPLRSVALLASNEVRLLPADERFEPVVIPHHDAARWHSAVQRCRAGDPGVLVIYGDGYMSWSPTQQFVEGYTAIGTEPEAS